MTTATQSLTPDEIGFLLSLKDSELETLLRELPQDLQTATLTELSKHRPGQKEAADRAGSREASRKWAAKERRSSQDIGPPPLPPTGRFAELRQESDGSLLHHLTICYPSAFTLPFGHDHLRLIHEMERAANEGLLKSIAMPRGSGKTTIVMRCVLWALLTGRRRFAVLVAATETAAQNLLDGAKSELMNNDTLAALYPQELHSFRRLEGEARLAGGQRCDGDLTFVEWRQHRIRFGYVGGSVCGGSVLSVCGLTGNVRGQQFTLPTGEILRPDFTVVDDPQTKESAKSPTQCADRHALMMGDVLGMSGPDKTIAGICTGTVIYKNDLMDRLLDRSQSPVWQGDKCSLVYDWGTGIKLWEKYQALLEGEMADGGDGRKATQFVKDNFNEMHAGAKVGWEQRKGESEVSALQHAWNLRIRDEAAFFAEYQNDPMGEAVEIPWVLDPVEIARRTNGAQQREVPADCEKLTAFIDIQKEVLFFCVVAWQMSGRGHIIDYGSYPDQKRRNWSKRHIAHKLSKVTKQSDSLTAIYAGLEVLVDDLMDRVFVRRDGSDRLMRIDRLGIDAAWGQATGTVRQFCMECRHVGRVHPTIGHYIGADSRPWHRFSHQKTDLLGTHCKMMMPPKGQRGVGQLLVDTNWWKSYAAERLVTHKGSEKAILLYDATPDHHRMFATHCAAEEPVVVTGQVGNKVVEWKQPKSGLENDYWDCLVGNCVLSSIEGVSVGVKHADGSGPRVQAKRRKYGVKKIN